MTGSVAVSHGSLSGKESGRNSTVAEHCISPGGETATSELGSMSLHSGTSAEQQPPLRLSSELLGSYRPMAVHALAGEQRPHVEPIGAPNRKRVGAPLSPKPPPATFYPLNPPRMSQEIAHPFLFGESLYHNRAFWDTASADQQTQKSDGKKNPN
ncbi:hypothetical protein GGH99_002583 [Coemansia sp. RSA 1285]|nr:hypothetical protein GGH99_002583 [Coemansia sp. RSA 1285]